MLRLNQLFFLHLLILLSALFLFVGILSYYTLHQIELDNSTKNLKTILNLIQDVDDVRELDKKIGARVSLFDKSGRLIADSRAKELKGSQKEITEALKKGWGRSASFLYVAKRLADGKILRLGKPLKEIQKHLFYIWLRFMGIFLLFIFLALLLSYLFSQRVKREFQNILNFLDASLHKDYEQPLYTSFSKEFLILSKQLKKVAKRLKKREVIKERYTKKIKNISHQRSELLSAISHEFKNPIAIIDGYTQTLLEEELSPSLQKRFLQKIASATKKMSAMIDRLALVMKFESGALKPQKEYFDICSLIKEAVGFIKERYKEREIIVNCQSFIVYADRQMMEMVILNLLDNALKYSKKRVNVIIERDFLKVIDKGIGIKEEEIEKLTKKFYRVGQSWDNSMGLGLYIVEYILKLHKTHLKIQSQYQKGSVFSFSLEPFKATDTP